MPQMMPLMWTFMLMSSTIMMLILISFIYFFTPHDLLNLNKKSHSPLPMLINKNPWNWKW